MTDIPSWIKQAIVVAVFFLIAFVINQPPQGHFIAGGDFYQLLQPAKHFDRYLYAWWNQTGQGTFNTVFPAYWVYSLLGLFDWLGMGSSTISGSIMFFFLYLSYLGFYLSIRVIYPDAKEYIVFGGALVYALNNFTITIFTYPWGITHHFLFYIFLPPLTFLYLKILTLENGFGKYVVAFCLVFLFSTVGYNNVAFLALFILIQFLILISAILLKLLKPNRKLLAKLLIFPGIYLVLFGPFVLAHSLSYFDLVRVVGSSVLGPLKGWISYTSSSFANTLLMAMDHQRFPWTEKGLMGTLAIGLSTCYFGILAFLILRKTKITEYAKVSYLFIALLIVFAFLTIRANTPFREISFYIYLSPLFIVFRSPDKIFSAIPFIYTSALVGLLHAVELKKKTVVTIFVVLLATPFAFYNRGIYDTIAHQDKDYHYSLSIPKEYYEIQEQINATKRLSSIISLPFSVVNSLNWAQYPKWNFMGTDILHLLYDKFYISANSYDHLLTETSLSWKEFVDKRGTPKELMNLIKKFSGEFVVFHRDITQGAYYVANHLNRSLKQLAKESKLKLLVSNSYFDLYQVSAENLIPLINSNTTLAFRRINPSKYEVTMNLKNSQPLVFHQSYDSQWRLYLQKYKKLDQCNEALPHVKQKITECPEKDKFLEGDELGYFLKTDLSRDTHIMIKNYANFWIIDPDEIASNYSSKYFKKNTDGSIDVRLVIYYEGQNYIYLTLIIHGIVLLTGLSYFLLIRRKKGFV